MLRIAINILLSCSILIVAAAADAGSGKLHQEKRYVQAGVPVVSSKPKAAAQPIARPNLSIYSNAAATSVPGLTSEVIAKYCTNRLQQSIASGTSYTDDAKLSFVTLCQKANGGIVPSSAVIDRSLKIDAAAVHTEEHASPELKSTTTPNSVFFKNRYYKLLSGESRYGSGYTCQGPALSAPEGWVIAPDDQESRLVIASDPWNTFAVVVASGKAYLTSNEGPLAGSQWMIPGAILNTNSFVEPKQHSVLYCNSQILIKQLAPNDYLTSEVQMVTIINAHSGTFSLSFNGYSSMLMPFNANSTMVEQALNSIPEITVAGSMNVTKYTGVDSSSFAITFPKDLLQAPLLVLSVNTMNSDAFVNIFQLVAGGQPMGGGGLGYTTPAPTTAPDVPVPSLDRMIVFRNRTFATLASTLVDGIGAPFNQSYAITLPRGWEIAPDTLESRMVISMHNWETMACVVLTGASYYTAAMGAAMAGMDTGYGGSIGAIISTTPGEGDSYYLTNYYPGMPQMQILIREIKQFSVIEGSWEFATIANVDPMGNMTEMNGYNPKYISCQPGGMAVPAGWELAVNDSFASAVARKYTWSTTFLAVADGQCYYTNTGGYWYSGNLVGMTNALTTYMPGIYGVGWCQMQILIRRPYVAPPTPAPTSLPKPFAFSKLSEGHTTTTIKFFSRNTCKRAMVEDKSVLVCDISE